MGTNQEAALSRRRFLQGAGAAGALAAISATLGCAPQAAAPAEETAQGEASAQNAWLGAEPEIAESGIVETFETEVLVVGGGTSGLFAAASAAESGAKTMVVEKFEGGGIRVGFGALNSRLQNEAGIVPEKHKIVNEPPALFQRQRRCATAEHLGRQFRRSR